MGFGAVSELTVGQCGPGSLRDVRMLGILCGLDSEAKIARAIKGATVACAAARPHKARDLARELVANGATRLMSFGIAGALGATGHLGDVVIGTRIAWRGAARELSRHPLQHRHSGSLFNSGLDVERIH